MRRRFQFSLRTMLAAMLVACGALGWLLWPIECPVCHGGNVDDQGHCRFGEGCPYYGVWDWCPEIPFPEEATHTGSPGHYLMDQCIACGHTGTIRRLDGMRGEIVESMPMKDEWASGTQE